MNAEELQENMYHCVCYYISENKEDDFLKFDLIDHGDGKGAIINKWFYDFPKPTNEKLMTYTVQEVKDYFDSINEIDDIDNYRFHKTTTQKLNKIPKTKIKNGDCVFNQSTGKIQIYINGQWRNVLLE